MIEITAAGQLKHPKLTTCIYGPSRLGKTWMAATWPKPIFLAAGQEHGETTLAVSFPHLPVVRIRSRQDMNEAVSLLRNYEGKNVFESVVIDSLTFYSDLVVGELLRGAKNNAMGPKDWGKLDQHLLKELMPTLHNMQYHVVWICLQQEVKDEDGKILRIQPLLYGKGADKIPAVCNLILQADTMQMQGPDKKFYPVPIARTAPYMNAIAGSRYGDAFKEGWIYNNFGEIQRRIGPWIGLPAQQSQVPGDGGGASQQPTQA